VRESAEAARAWGIARSGLDLDPLFRTFDEHLRGEVPYVIGSWSTHDPATGLFTSCTMTGAPKDPENEAHLFRCEFSEGEPATYHSLIAQGTDDAILSRATEGELDRASRFREIFGPFGLTDELRVVLRIDGTAWGSATLLRTGGRFEPRHAEAVRAIARQAADGIRLALLRAAAARPEVVDEPPGIVLARPDGKVAPLTGPAERWLAVGKVELVTAINVAAAAIRRRPTSQSATTRVVLPDGRVLALRAAGITSSEGEPDGIVPVIVDRARPAEVSALMVDAYGLTRRQREVLDTPSSAAR
jgi:hypothetical protein